MSKKILILGKGFIGQRIQEEFGCFISDKKIYTFRDATKEIEKYNPRIIINSIGYIGEQNIDSCESDIDRSLWANAFLPMVLAEIAIRQKIKLVHISSGCIYHFNYLKDRPIKEDKLPDFLNLFYSRTKIYPERALEILSRQHPFLILRPRVPLDNRPHPKNLLTKLIQYKKVIDVPNSITYLPDFVRALKHLLRINARGIYNVVNKGTLRYPALLDVYRQYVPDFQYQIIDNKKLGLVRPNLILATNKLEKSGFKVRPIKDILQECVQEYLSQI